MSLSSISKEKGKNVLFCDDIELNTINNLAYPPAQGGITIGAPTAASNNNALIFVGNQLRAQVADSAFGGILTNTTQSIKGNKIFNDGITLPNFEQINATFQSLGQPNLTVSVRGYKVNNIVTIILTLNNQTITTVGAALKSWSDVAGAIPVAFRSASSLIASPISVVENGGIITNVGTCGILTGNLFIELPASLPAGNITFYDCSFSYLAL